MVDQSVSRFWDNYIIKTKAYRVKESAVKWYVRNAERYIKDHEDLRLSLHTSEYVENYLNDKSRNAPMTKTLYSQ